MAFIDKLKKYFSTPEVEKAPITQDTLSQTIINFDQLKNKIKDKEAINKSHQNELKKTLRDEIHILNQELEISIRNLEHFSLDKIKEQEKIKLIVKENLGLYVAYLKKLKSEIKLIDEENAQEFLKQLISKINDFSRLSHAPYEKANYLVGEEITGSKRITSIFMSNLAKISQQGQEIFKEEYHLTQINKLNNEINEKNSSISDIDKSINHSKEGIEKSKRELERIKEKLTKIKSSNEYNQDLEIKQKHNEQLRRLEDEIRIVKQKIDFRRLAKFYHNDKSKSQIIIDYSSNFKNALKEDNSLQIISLIKEAENQSVIELKNIQDKLINLSETIFTKSEEVVLNLENSQKEYLDRVISLENHINIEQKKKEKILIKKKELCIELNKITSLVFPGLELRLE